MRPYFRGEIAPQNADEVERLEARNRELERLVLALADKLATLAGHLSYLAEKKEKRRS